MTASYERLSQKDAKHCGQPVNVKLPNDSQGTPINEDDIIAVVIIPEQNFPLNHHRNKIENKSSKSNKR